MEGKPKKIITLNGCPVLEKMCVVLHLKPTSMKLSCNTRYDPRAGVALLVKDNHHAFLILDNK